MDVTKMVHAEGTVHAPKVADQDVEVPEARDPKETQCFYIGDPSDDGGEGDVSLDEEAELIIGEFLGGPKCMSRSRRTWRCRGSRTS